MQDRQVDTQPLVEMVERLHCENMQLAGRVGFLEGKLQDAEQKIWALSAPVSAESTVIDQASRDTRPPHCGGVCSGYRQRRRHREARAPKCEPRARAKAAA